MTETSVTVGAKRDIAHGNRGFAPWTDMIHFPLATKVKFLAPVGFSLSVVLSLFTLRFDTMMVLLKKEKPLFRYLYGEMERGEVIYIFVMGQRQY